MKKLRIIFLTIIFFLILFFYYNIFIQKISYDEKKIFDLFNKYKNDLNGLVNFSIDNENDQYEEFNQEYKIQNYISTLIKENNIYSFNEETGFLSKFTAYIVNYTKEPVITVLDRNSRIIKKYEYKTDFNLKIKENSENLNITKKGYTLVDPASFEPKEGEILLISSAYYSEKYDPIFNDSKICAIITDQSASKIKSSSSIFFGYKDEVKNNNTNKKDSGFYKIYVKPEVFSELATYTYQNYRIHIEANWEITEKEFLQNIAFFPGKIKDQLIIFQIPILENINTISLMLPYLNLLNSNKNRLIRSVIFFFSNKSIEDFPSELNFINSFKSFPKNTKVLILENLNQSEINLLTFLTNKNKDNLNSFVKEITGLLKTDDIKYNINYYDTENIHFPYIFNKIPAITMNLIFDSSNSLKSPTNIEKNYFKVYSKLIYSLITNVPLIYKLFFCIIIIIFFSLLFVFAAISEKKDKAINDKKDIDKNL